MEDLDKGAEGSQNKSERSGDAKKLIICVVGKYHTMRISGIMPSLFVITIRGMRNQNTQQASLIWQTTYQT